MNGARTGLWLLMVVAFLATSMEARAQTAARSAALALEDGPSAEVVPLPESLARPQGDFPALPPDPYMDDLPALPSLEQELWNHGGSYLYSPEGDQLNWPAETESAHVDILRLPETWQEPRPVTTSGEFLGTGPPAGTHLKWFGDHGYMWDVRFVGSGSYELFGFAFEQNSQRQDAVGHQLRLDLDLRLTGTERFPRAIPTSGRAKFGRFLLPIQRPPRDTSITGMRNPTGFGSKGNCKASWAAL